MAIDFLFENNLAQIILNRPEKSNALDCEMIVDLIDDLNQLAQQKNCRVLLLMGEGEHFCAGADLVWMQKMATASREVNRQDAYLLGTLLQKIYLLHCPVIALVHGKTFGGGMGLIAASDMVIAADNAEFAFPETRIGLCPSVVSPYVIGVIGERAARYYFLTGEIFSVQRAFELGLVQQIVNQKNLLQAGKTLANKILLNSPRALTATKKLITQVVTEPISDELSRLTAEHLAVVRHSKDAQEGMAAFFAKRKPNWSEV